MTIYRMLFRFFFFNDTATTEIYTLSLHDALPIYALEHARLLSAESLRLGAGSLVRLLSSAPVVAVEGARLDRKSTRLNSRHANISYAVFCLKKKNYNSISFLHHILPATPIYRIIT